MIITTARKRWLLLKATALGPEFVQSLRQAFQEEYLRGLTEGTTQAVEQFHKDIMSVHGR